MQGPQFRCQDGKILIVYAPVRAWCKGKKSAELSKTRETLLKLLDSPKVPLRAPVDGTKWIHSTRLH